MKAKSIKNKKYKLSSIESAVSDFKKGKVVIVVDDEDRENEGDFLAAAEKVTPEMINFDWITDPFVKLFAKITQNKNENI